jgi:hypothetical protein
VLLHQLAAFFDRRHRAGLGALTPASSQPACEEYRAALRLAIQRGFDRVAVPQPTGLVYSRADFVNEYWHPTATESRMDFQYYEHDISQLTRVLVESFQFTKRSRHEPGSRRRGGRRFSSREVRRPWSPTARP